MKIKFMQLAANLLEHLLEGLNRVVNILVNYGTSRLKVLAIVIKEVQVGSHVVVLDLASILIAKGLQVYQLNLLEDHDCLGNSILDEQVVRHLQLLLRDQHQLASFVHVLMGS